MPQASDSTQATAESVLSLTDLDDGHERSIEICFDATTNALLVMESQCWTAERSILFEEGKNARYVRIPLRPSYPPFLNYEVLGISGGRIYYRMDNRVYALPFGRLETETDLGFTIG